MLASDAAGNLYFIGTGAIDFGGSLIGQGSSVVKFDEAGNYVFGRAYGPASFSAAAVDRSGQIWLGGDSGAQDDVDFGDGHVVHGYGAYLALLSSADGHFLAATHLDGEAEITSIAADACNDRVTVAGIAWPANGALLLPESVVSLYDATLRLQWSYTAASTSWGSVAVDGAGNSWVAGAIESNRHNLSHSQATLTGFTPDGTPRYAQTWGDPGETSSSDVEVSIGSDGTMWLVGRVRDYEINFGLGPLVSMNREIWDGPSEDAVLVRLR